jgi:hypothetical protein
MSWKLYQIDRFLMSLDFSKSVADPNLYSVGDENLILMTYSESLVVENKQALTSDFHKGSEYDTLLQEVSMKFLGKYTVGILKKYDRMQIHRDGFKEED